MSTFALLHFRRSVAHAQFKTRRKELCRFQTFYSGVAEVRRLRTSSSAKLRMWESTQMRRACPSTGRNFNVKSKRKHSRSYKLIKKTRMPDS